MNDLTQKLRGLAPEKRRLIEMLLQRERPSTSQESKSSEGPRSPAEKTMIEIWESILGKSPIGIHDDFFQLGGDSIQAIRVTAKAREAGIEIGTSDLFNNPTIAEVLAGRDAATPATEANEEESGDVAPLGPVQSWFFEQNFPEPDHWNEVVLLKTHPTLTMAILEAAVRAVLEHHESLRLRFTRTPDGVRMDNASSPQELPIDRIMLDPDGVAREADRLMGGLSLAEGRTIRFYWMTTAEAENSRLLIVAHHLVIDGISWRVLLEDLSNACAQLLSGSTVDLGRRPAGFRRWTQFLHRWSATANCQDQLPWWIAEQSIPAVALPADAHTGPNTEATANEVPVIFDAGETQRILRAAGRDIQPLLLAGLVATLRDWSGSNHFRLDVEGHGREPLPGTPDVSRTTGWFTSIFPFGVKLAAGTEIAGIFDTVRQKLRALPANGVGYGVLRYISRHLPAPTSTAPVIFNYLGQFDGVLPANSSFVVAPESTGSACGRENHRPHLLQVVGAVMKGCLRFRFIYSAAVHSEESISKQAKSFETAVRGLLDYLETQRQDAAHVDLNQSELQEIARRYANV